MVVIRMMRSTRSSLCKQSLCRNSLHRATQHTEQKLWRHGVGQLAPTRRPIKNLAKHLDHGG